MSENSQNEYKVEYLCTLNSDGDFCTSISGFSSLLESYEKLKIDGNKIIWGEAEFHFEIFDGTVLNSKHKFFHLRLTNSVNENKADFLAVLKVIRTILSKVNNNQPPEILWDDISSEYAVLSYPVIHELENLMRKLITKFMITKVGLSWTKDNIPREVAESIKSTSTSKKQNYIYDTDFIQLSNFLFKEYTTANTDEFVEKIKKAKNISDLNLDDLKKIVPLSNWTRYFNPIVECTSDELKSKWDKLYILRCKVAHNNFMDEDDFENLISNSDKVKSIIQDAIRNLDKVIIDEEEKEELAENAAINLNKYYGEFVVKWKEVESILATLNLKNPDSKKSFSSMYIIQYLYELGYVNEKEMENFNDLRGLRNLIVHESNLNLNEIKLNSAFKDLDFWNAKLTKISHIILHPVGWYEISQFKDDDFRFVLKSSNGEILLTSEKFKSKLTLLNTIESIKTLGDNLDSFRVSISKNGKHYFNIVLKNNNIVATSQFYNDLVSFNSGINLVMNNIKANKIIDLSQNDC